MTPTGNILLFHFAPTDPMRHYTLAVSMMTEGYIRSNFLICSSSTSCNQKAACDKTPTWSKKKRVSRNILVQVNGRLIGSELFNISTWGGAVKKGYISGQGLLSSRDLCKSKWAASVKVHVPPFMRSTPSPSSSLRSCSPKAVWRTKALVTGGEQLWISPVLEVAN